MNNILSYMPCTRIKGIEIKEWIRFHTDNQTEYSKEANKMIKYLSIADDNYYFISRGNYQASERQFCVIEARCRHMNENGFCLKGASSTGMCKQYCSYFER